MSTDEVKASVEVSKYEHFPIWNCEITASEPGAVLNVGSKMELSCRGDFIDLPQVNHLQIEFDDKKDQYKLKILSVKTFDYKSAHMIVTSYLAGQHNDVKFYVGDKNKGFRVEGLSWKVESVLNPEKQQEPFPAWGPFGMSMPIWYWLSIAFGFFVIVFFIYKKIRVIYERRRLIDELSAHGTALSPYNQFSKDIRSLSRGYQNRAFDEKYAEEFSQSSYIAQLERVFRQYLMRELLVPTFDWGDGQIIKEIKRRHKDIYTTCGKDIAKLFKELQRAMKAIDTLEDSDREQLTNMCRQVSEKIYQIRKKVK